MKTPYLVLFASLILGSPAMGAAGSSKGNEAHPVQGWVQRSNGYAQILLAAQGPFQPERTSFFGVAGFDDAVSDLGPRGPARLRAALAAAKTTLLEKRKAERDPQAQQDLDLLIGAAEDASAESRLNEDRVRPWVDVGQLAFNGIQVLLRQGASPARQAAAVRRLRRYVGLVPGATPLTELATARYAERVASGLVEPTAGEVEASIANVATYRAGIAAAFARFNLSDPQAMEALDRQLARYAAWNRSVVLPHARRTYVLEPALYSLALRSAGIDVAPDVLIDRARLEFMETRAAMQQLAPVVAKAHGFKETTPVAVLRALKADALSDDAIEPFYRDSVLPGLDRLIVEHSVATLPDRPVTMRVGTPAENASQPAPHFVPAPFDGGALQSGEFVLPLSNPDATTAGRYDDFNYPAAAWSLAAHEGRPGHELQFSAIANDGISLARTLFAFNAVNVEGWALYAESEVLPYLPPDAQLVALQFRLQRAMRAMLDPMLNLGLIDRETALRLIVDQGGFSPALARQEVDRYTVRAPGQAGSYFYGYSKLLEIRAEAELQLGARFDRKAFNDFILAQGLLPPALIRKAVQERFVHAAQTGAAQ